jgi:hypothetical protein
MRRSRADRGMSALSVSFVGIAVRCTELPYQRHRGRQSTPTIGLWHPYAMRSPQPIKLQRGERHLTVAGEVLITKVNRAFGESVVLWREGTGPEQPEYEYFLGWIGCSPFRGEEGLWRNDQGGFVTAALHAPSRLELLELMVLAFHREHPRRS